MGEGEQPGGETNGESGGQAQQAGGDNDSYVADLPAGQAWREAYFADLPQGTAWGESITRGQAAHWEQILRAWEHEADRGGRRGPFQEYKLSGADVFWLAARTLAGSGEVSAVTAAMDGLGRADDDDVDGGRVIPNLTALHLDGANLSHANLAHADLPKATLAGADLSEANCEGAFLDGTDLSQANLRRVNLSAASLFKVNFSAAGLPDANLSFASLVNANLTGAALTDADLSHADLNDANLTGTDVGAANLADASLHRANLSGANLWGTNLAGANLYNARLNVETELSEVRISTTTILADVIWNTAPLARVDWQTLPVLGDETQARQHHDSSGKKKDAASRGRDYQAALRAYRLLAVALRGQGLNEHADRYAYRAQLMHRQTLRLQRLYGRALGSWLLDAIAGYGYKPVRSVVTYLLVILSFAAAFFALTNFALTPFLPSQSSPLAWYEAIVLSVSSFHGRGLFPSGLSLGDPIAILAAGEAIIGLLIEITFIATFTNRFFAR